MAEFNRAAFTRKRKIQHSRAGRPAFFVRTRGLNRISGLMIPKAAEKSTCWQNKG
jgi:hypothetical protein